ncbi:MAG TPA: SLC13 family permease [Bradyrhizobium sp.]|nr:SLC13 family permease [Bradyrhizobium sp.]
MTDAKAAAETPTLLIPRRHIVGLAVSAFVGLVIWFMPPLQGLTITGQHAMAVVLMTVLLWITEAVPTGVAALLMIAIVLCFMPEVPPHTFLEFWTSDSMWFILVCFIFSTIMEVSGLGHRLSVYVFSPRRLILIDLGLLLINALFSLVGMNSAFPKMALLLPLVASFGALSKMSKDDPYLRHLGFMIAALSTNTGLLVYPGFSWNLVLGRMGGFNVDFGTWFAWFFVPALVFNLMSFFIIYFLFMPPRGEHFDFTAEQEELKKLGPVTGLEMKTVVWLVATVALWATGPRTGISAGWVAVLAAAGMMLPGIGLVSFKQFAEGTNWNVVFMLMGIFAIGDLSSTGFAHWIWSHILPTTMPHNPMLSLMAISAMAELLHVPLGSLGTSMALAVPSLSTYGQTIGMSKELVSFVAYVTVVGQYFFSYQNAGLIFGLAYGLWSARDVFKYGVAMFVATPITLGVLLYPWWLHMGWIQ